MCWCFGVFFDSFFLVWGFPVQCRVYLFLRGMILVLGVLMLDA